MTYEDIKKANATLSTMDIKGKDYVLVNERIRAFRMLFPAGTIRTKILSMNDGVVTMIAEVYDGDLLMATGHAQEKESSTYINKTSYIENCETSAVGRALGMLGIGIDTSVASYEEVATAMANQGSEIYQNTGEPATEKQLYLLTKLGYTGRTEGMTKKQASAEIEKINEAHRGH